MKVKQSNEGAESLLYNQLNHIDKDKNRMVSIGKLFFLAAILLIIIGGGRHLLMGQLGTGMNAVSEAGVGNGLAPESNAGDEVAKSEVGGTETSVGTLYTTEEYLKLQVHSLLVGNKDWCDCGKQGKLYVRPKDSPNQVRSFSPSSGIAYAVWCNDVKTVEWRCDGMGWKESAHFDNGQRVWPLKFTHETKNTCHRCWWSG